MSHIRGLLLAPLLMLYIGSGCTPRVTPSASAGTPAVRILAYINVSSGCQQATVDYLNQLQQKNRSHVSLELVDFGDGGEGSERWQASGHKCMTIEINGSSVVKFPTKNGMKAVAFRMPAGLMWTHEDLGQAVQAALDGTLQPATEEEAAGEETPAKIDATVTTDTVSNQGKSFAAVKINGYPVILLANSSTAKTRIAQAARTLKTWLTESVKPSDLQTKQVADGVALMAGGSRIITLSSADAKPLGKSTTTVASDFLQAIRHALVAPRPR